MPRDHAAAIAATSIMLAAFAGNALASDYSHECRSADGRYEINDGTLAATGQSERAIPYDTVRETVLSERLGYCLSQGGKFEFAAKTYVVTIRFREDGRPVERDLMCELSADGLPAAYACEKEVVTRDFKAEPKSGHPPSAVSGASSSTWSHNGSQMRLEASGQQRRFVYVRPRKGMLAAGATPGDSVFEGRREGLTYTGTAYVFSRACGKTAYPVSGAVSDDQRRVVLTGEAPILSADCRPRAHKPDRLIFDLIEP